MKKVDPTSSSSAGLRRTRCWILDWLELIQTNPISNIVNQQSSIPRLLARYRPWLIVDGATKPFKARRQSPECSLRMMLIR
jgi:hypothetical protein